MPLFLGETSNMNTGSAQSAASDRIYTSGGEAGMFFVAFMLRARHMARHVYLKNAG